MTTEFKTRPLLILDLDETLVFGSEWELKYRCDFEVGPYFIYTRPFLDEFLKLVSSAYDLAIWSSASSEYVHAIADRIGQGFESKWQFVWARSRCIERTDMETKKTFYIKDLKKTKRFGYGLERTLDCR